MGVMSSLRLSMHIQGNVPEGNVLHFMRHGTASYYALALSFPPASPDSPSHYLLYMFSCHGFCLHFPSGYEKFSDPPMR